MVQTIQKLGKSLCFPPFSLSCTYRKTTTHVQQQAEMVLIPSPAKMNVNVFPFSGVPGKVAEMTDVKMILPIIMV